MRARHDIELPPVWFVLVGNSIYVRVWVIGPTGNQSSVVEHQGQRIRRHATETLQAVQQASRVARL